MRLKTVVPFIVAALVTGGCAGESQPAELAAQVGQPVAVEGGEYRDVTPAELQALLAEQDLPLINVHVPFAGDLPGTDASIPFDQIESNLDQLPADRDEPVVIYCRSGSMSAEAAQALVRAGYTNVFNLAGGFRAWTAAGLPMADG